jgi:DNA (cytosine-5)-methyltransferase 1
MGGNATPIIDQDELEYGVEPWVVAYHRRLLQGGRPLKRAPRRLRRITVEEAAVLQSFPLHWSLCGPQVAQLRQVGNAVPPKLSFVVAESLRAALTSCDQVPDRNLQLAA